MYVLRQMTKVSCVIDLILEQDAGHLVSNKALGVVRVAGGEQHVVVHAPLHYSQHQVPPCFHRCVAVYVSPQLHCIGEVVIFRRTLFVLPVPRFCLCCQYFARQEIEVYHEPHNPFAHECPWYQSNDLKTGK
jgi:hypothetical protein